jgi:hypothetical protein
MRRHWLIAFGLGCWATAVCAQFSFHQIDNFEAGNQDLTARWWRFGNLKAEVVRLPTAEATDLVALTGGDWGLRLSGGATNWFVGGVGSDLRIDSTSFSRLQLDLRGDGRRGGKLVIELFDDDQGDGSIEQDPKNNFNPPHDDKWVAEVAVLGRGATRVSIPFTAFKLVNPGAGNGRWGGPGGLAKLQLVAIADKKDGSVDFIVDNLLLTY